MVFESMKAIRCFRSKSKTEDEKPVECSLRYILLAHHPPNQLDHTIKIKLGGDIFYLCARCTGVLTGLFFSVIFTHYFEGISTTSYPLIFAVCLIPGTFDWIGHNTNVWKSNNVVRVSTGVLLGVPIGIAISSLIFGNFLIIVEFVLLSCIYLILLLIVCYRVPQLEKHLQEYDEFASRLLKK